jgi:SNF2 family DNA or RNA helicase
LGNNNPKLELLKEDLELSEGKVIIWAMYKADIAGIIMVLRESKHHYILSTDNDSDIKFQTDPNIKVYLGQISTGIGTTLTQAQTTIYYSHSLNLEHRLQSLDRNYRISQKQKVLVIDYVCEGTIEERVLELLEKKEDVRSFVQHNALCAACTQSIICLTNKVQPYTHKCIYFDNRLNAERKLTLKIEGISECDG